MIELKGSLDLNDGMINNQNVYEYCVGAAVTIRSFEGEPDRTSRELSRPL